jgi:hypothetical protein
MISSLKMAALGSVLVLTIVGAAAPATAQNRCLRFDNKSLLSDSSEGQDAYDRAAAAGNRCFVNQAPGVTILPAPKADQLNGSDYYFLSRRQRELLHLTD